MFEVERYFCVNDHGSHYGLRGKGNVVKAGVSAGKGIEAGIFFDVFLDGIDEHPRRGQIGIADAEGDDVRALFPQFDRFSSSLAKRQGGMFCSLWE